MQCPVRSWKPVDAEMTIIDADATGLRHGYSEGPHAYGTQVRFSKRPPGEHAAEGVPGKLEGISMLPYILSLAVGLGVGVVYGLVGVKSPAPPIIALIGLLGILVGEMAVSYWRGHSGVVATLLHRKSFAVVQPAPPTQPPA